MPTQTPACAGSFRPVTPTAPRRRLLNARRPAASQGGMNNLAMGESGANAWGYYETLGGGLSAVQTHMTNTRNTPVEVLEMRYPVRVRRYALRWGINRLNDETLPPRSSREAGPSDRLRIETPGGDWGKPILQKD